MEKAVIREVKDEVGVKATPHTILGVYSDPARDLRGHMHSVVFIVDFTGEPVAGDDAAGFKWVPLPLDDAIQAAFDHKKIIQAVPLPVQFEKYTIYGGI